MNYLLDYLYNLFTINTMSSDLLSDKLNCFCCINFNFKILVYLCTSFCKVLFWFQN